MLFLNLKELIIILIIWCRILFLFPDCTCFVTFRSSKSWFVVEMVQWVGHCLALTTLVKMPNANHPQWLLYHLEQVCMFV